MTAYESMFSYDKASDESYDMLQDLDFSPQFGAETSDSLPADADQVCDSNVACLHDYSVTKDREIATATRRTADQLSRSINALGQSPSC